MKAYKKQRHGISFWTVWFAEEPIKHSGIIQYRQASFKEDNSEEFLSMITDLMETEEEITARFSKNCRNEVNRAGREGVSSELLMGDLVTLEEIEEFIQFFDEFWKSKGVMDLDLVSLRQELMGYKEQSILAISKAMLEGTCIVYHIAVVADTCVRLLHSASLYRSKEEGNSKIIGMANRYLHKADLLAFKECGMRRYDWGGAGDTPEVASITKFKEGFGGTKVVQYNTRVHKGLIANLFKILVERG